MDARFLREEFLRLSGLYPELRNGLVVGEVVVKDKTWGKEFDRSRALIEQFGLQVVGEQFMRNDVRAHTFYLWKGPSDCDRAYEAVGSFEQLANIAGGLPGIGSLPGEIPQDGSISVGVGAVDKVTGEVAITYGETEDLIHRWISHIFLANAIRPKHTEFRNKDGDVFARCDILLLRKDTFRASVFALDKTASVDTNELDFATSPQAVRDLKGTHNERTPVIQRETEWRKVYELLEEQGIPEGDEKRDKFVKDYNAQYEDKPRPGKPKKKWPKLTRALLGQRIADYRKKPK